MNTEFWHERWSNNEIGFHLDTANQALTEHWHTMSVDLGCRVLVPLCGKSVDIIWLLKQGYQIIGAELSEIALDALAEAIELEFSLAVDKHEVDGLIFYRAAGILLICGDWFALTPQDVGPIDAVYDRAALIAMPENMRGDYVAQLRRLSSNAPQLLVTLDYDSELMSGPPFSVPRDKVEVYYGADMNIDVLQTSEQINVEPRFKERGLTSIVQTVYRLTHSK